MRQDKRTGVKRLSNKQLMVIEDLFEGSCNEMEVMKRHRVSKKIYRKWLENQNFIDELVFRIESAKRQSELIIAKYAPAAAIKLVKLTESDKEETSRKACLDIMAHPRSIETGAEKNAKVCESIKPETADRILSVLAEEGKAEN